MKYALLLLAIIATPCAAIPVDDSHLTVSTPTIVGYKEVEKTYNGWGGGFLHIFGHKHKHYQIPIYSEIHDDNHVPAVPEPSTYAMLLAGAGMVAWRVLRKE